MCGLTGVFFFDPERQVDSEVLTRMREATTHRGPDDHGVCCRRNVGFGFNRLSIIDLSGGHQPMCNEDGTVWLVFNGEIYNYKQLRTDLIRAGYEFRTESDTETVLRAWEEYGEQCVAQFRGMFAFAIWDARRETLFAARDRIGIKPFYYYADREFFAFASEIKSLIAIPEIPKAVEDVVLADYLRYGHTLTPNTLFRNIRKLPPAHTLTVRRGSVVTKRYWDLPFEPDVLVTEEEALSQLESVLKDTVQLHLLSDVPLGVFLSGGLDSSALVATMAQLGIRDIKTFSIGYDEGESELGNAQVIAKQFRTDHHAVRLTPSEFRDRLPDAVWHLDEPVVDAPSVALYCLARFAKGAVTVALSGEGADEMFGGYPTYGRMLAFDKLNKLPFAALMGGTFRRLLPVGKVRKNAGMLGVPLEHRYRTSVVFPLEEIRRMLPGALIHDDPTGELARAYVRCEHRDSLSRMSYVDLQTWMPDDLLLKADRMTMAHGLELRVPYLDHIVVEFAARLPAKLKVCGYQHKYILKRLMQKRLPARIVHQQKKGFSIPTKTWFRKSLAGFIRETLLARDSPCLDYFPRQEILRVLQAHRHRDCSNQIYALLVFDQWMRTFMKAVSPEREALKVPMACG